MATEKTEFVPAAERALEFVPDGGVVGLGTGRAAATFIHALGKRVQQGLRVRGVPTSRASAELASGLGIALVTLDEIDLIDVDVDGADEVDPRGNLIKGRGGAMVREMIVAATARKLVIIVGPEKLVPILGTHGSLPVEVVPFGVALCSRRLAMLGLALQLRRTEGKPFVSDNGNNVLDVAVSALEQPAELERAIRAIPGVVGTGLFLGMSPTVLIQRGDQVEVRGST